MFSPGQFAAGTSADGAFVQQRYALRDRITADGSSRSRRRWGDTTSPGRASTDC